jgi:conflict system STAND superfamily ATPase
MTLTPASFCPYVGLQPYTEAEREYFFGRERDTRIISSNLYAASLTVLYGASGVGKSSVLMAGVVPRLRGAPRTAVVFFNAWQDASFLSALKAECIKAVETVQQKPLTIDHKLPLDDLLFAAAQAFGGSILILLDQFEEYFLYHPESQTGNTFDAEFARAINRQEIDAPFLLSLREDGLAKMDRFRVRIPNLLGNTLRLEHLDAMAAEDAIRKPLEVFNIRFPEHGAPITIADELVHEVIRQVRAGQVSFIDADAGLGQTQGMDENSQIETPFLQLVMTRLWREEIQSGSNILHLDTLQRLGGAKKIVRTHLDSAMERLPRHQRDVCARIFRFMVTPSGTKIAYSGQDLSTYTDLHPQQVESILQRLTRPDIRILRAVIATSGEKRETRYEIYHDAMSQGILDWRTRYLRQKDRRRRRNLAILGIVLFVALGALFYVFTPKAELGSTFLLTLLACLGLVIVCFLPAVGLITSIRSILARSR